MQRRQFESVTLGNANGAGISIQMLPEARSDIVPSQDMAVKALLEGEFMWSHSQSASGSVTHVVGSAPNTGLTLTLRLGPHSNAVEAFTTGHFFERLTHGML